MAYTNVKLVNINVNNINSSILSTQRVYKEAGIHLEEETAPGKDSTHSVLTHKHGRD